MSRKERRAAWRATFNNAAKALQPAWDGDTATRMAAIQNSMHIINNSDLPLTYNGVAQLYVDYVYTAESDPEFPPELLDVLRRMLGRVETILEQHRQRSQRLYSLAEDIVDTQAVWDKYTQKD
jgi:hypothetical protein